MYNNEMPQVFLADVNGQRQRIDADVSSGMDNTEFSENDNEWMPVNERFELPSGLNMPDGHPFFDNQSHEQSSGYQYETHPQDGTLFRSTNALTLRIPSQEDKPAYPNSNTGSSEDSSFEDMSVRNFAWPGNPLPSSPSHQSSFIGGFISPQSSSPMTTSGPSSSSNSPVSIRGRPLGRSGSFSFRTPSRSPYPSLSLGRGRGRSVSVSLISDMGNMMMGASSGEGSSHNHSGSEHLMVPGLYNYGGRSAPASPADTTFMPSPFPEADATFFVDPSQLHRSTSNPGTRRTRHVGSDAITHATTARRTREAKFFCDIEGCRKSFTAAHNLKNHKNSHEGRRDFECSICHSAYTTRHVRDRHTRTCRGHANVEEGQ